MAFCGWRCSWDVPDDEDISGAVLADLWYKMVIVLSYLSMLSENGNNERKQYHNRIETLLNKQTGPFYYPFLAVMWSKSVPTENKRLSLAG